MLDPRRLRLLRELRRRGTVHAVARALSYAPSTVSQQLAQLELEANATLFERVGRRLQLTPAGELLAEGSSVVLDELERLEQSLAEATGSPSGTVRLAVFQSAALGIVPRALTLLAEQYPAVRVEITQREPESALDEVWARDFDLVIAEEYPAHAAPRRTDLDRVPLLNDALRLGVPPTTARIRSLADAASAAWVMEPRGTASRHFAEQQCRLAGFEPDVRFETADLQAHIRLVEAGHAVALLPDLVWGGETPRIPLITLEGDPQRTVFTSARVPAAVRPAIVAVRAVLTQAVAFVP
ncbi:DNA-binding transcriptional LysR family regulator [Microcella putealis]|uniref:DNA-binding transcriptional LysR family regulator n=1 Tax=Microcella putealis TaxID=337005 RepID=A0A4Q7LQ52_9MICO|nr:LysR family transcriptional regulator [Microcella putealis]RZS56312.1 DNA-binding transcriptional LysR family regulator [Microcella putealis]TQM27202.1 DNA-binding transcriptional LysR family regulator [Microcella putealis]